MAHESNGRGFDPGARAILTELRDLRVEMRAERRQGREERRQDRVERRRAEERLERLIGDLRADSLGLQKTLKALGTDMRTIGVAIVKGLNRQRGLLERIDRKLGVRGNGRPENGGRA